MKRWIKSNSAVEQERIVIEFQYRPIEDGVDTIEGGKTVKKPHGQKKQPIRVFKNTQVVIRDVKAYLNSKGLSVEIARPSNRENSDSTYYDIDIRVCNSSGSIDYLYLRVADHFSDPTIDEQRNRYYDGRTRSHLNLSETEDVRNRWEFESIVVDNHKKYHNYDLAMNYVKREIDRILVEKNILPKEK